MSQLSIAGPARRQAPNSPVRGPSYCAGQEILVSRAHAKVYRIASGWAFAGRILLDGRRQIVTFLLPGDPLNAAAVLGGDDGLTVFALSDIDLDSTSPTTQHEAISAALSQLARLSEQSISLGRRTAYERVATFLLQIGERLDVKAGRRCQCHDVPLRLEHVSDHLGLSVVHVSRTMTQLRADGLGGLRRGTLELHDRARLAQLAA